MSFFGHGYEGEQISVSGGYSIGPQNCTGNWHLVILNACSSGANTGFADALHINGYSNRGFIGWFSTIQVAGLNEWSGHFVGKVGTESLRMAHLHAANLCNYSTPARFYGDTSWYGYAWN